MMTGTMELRTLSQRYLTEGLMIAVLFHFSLIGGMQALQHYFNTKEIIPLIIVNRSNDWVRVDLSSRSAIPNVSVSEPAHSSVGTPIPIPETEIDPEATIEIHNRQSGSAGNDSGVVDETGLSISDGTTISGDETPPEPFTVVEKMPVPISYPAPQYPEIAKRANVEGTVYVALWVTKEGKVKKSSVVKSTSGLFDQASMDAAMLWTFTPAIMNSGPVSVWVTVPFKFRLHDKESR
jgi:TonB family protein